mmetsp:Transcript_8749/g.14733  ORF Transcript_8749/g.14733 Transcript_8749/m.14733 type:complete len:241 (-) Transcript_8749:47-769(-)
MAAPIRTRLRPAPARRCGGIHLPPAPPKPLPPLPVPGPVPASVALFATSFFSRSSLSLRASRSIPSRAAARAALVSSTRMRSATSSSSRRFNSSAFMSSSSVVAAPVTAPLRAYVAANASSSHSPPPPPPPLPAPAPSPDTPAALSGTGAPSVAGSTAADGALVAVKASVKVDTGGTAPLEAGAAGSVLVSVDKAGASTCTVEVIDAASILLALKPLNPFFFFFFAKNVAASDIVKKIQT